MGFQIVSEHAELHEWIVLYPFYFQSCPCLHFCLQFSYANQGPSSMQIQADHEIDFSGSGSMRVAKRKKPKRFLLLLFNWNRLQHFFLFMSVILFSLNGLLTISRNCRRWCKHSLGLMRAREWAIQFGSWISHEVSVSMIPLKSFLHTVLRTTVCNVFSWKCLH